jgi:hypothetical protein
LVGGAAYLLGRCREANPAIGIRVKLTLAQANRFAGMNRLQFQRLLASRKIPLHYTVEDFREEVVTLRRTGFL